MARALALKVPAPTFPQTFNLDVQNPGSYVVSTFLDVGNDGVISATDPGTIGGFSPAIDVNGWTDAGTLTIDGRDLQGSLTMSHNAGSYGDSYGLNVEVRPGLKRPTRVWIQSADRIASPIDFGLAPDNSQGLPVFGGSFWLSGQSPMPTDTVTLGIEATDGTQSQFVVTQAPFTRAVPALKNPMGTIGTLTPSFSWTPVDPAWRQNFELRYRYQFAFYWAQLPGSQSALAWPADAGVLQTATNYSWTVSATDAYGNQCSATADFSTQ